MYIGIELDLGVSVHGVVFISLITYWGKANGYIYLCNSYVHQNTNSVYLIPSQDINFTAQHCVVVPCPCHGVLDSFGRQKNHRTM